MTGRVISRHQLISIATGVVRVNNPNFLKEDGGDVVLTNKWARRALEKLNCPVFSQKKFTFKRNISALVSEHKIHSSLIMNIDLPSCANTGKYTFSFKGAKNIPIKGMDGKYQITATFAVSCAGEFLSIQLIYARKTERSLPKYSFPPSFW